MYSAYNIYIYITYIYIYISNNLLDEVHRKIEISD